VAVYMVSVDLPRCIEARACVRVCVMSARSSSSGVSMRGVHGGVHVEAPRDGIAYPAQRWSTRIEVAHTTSSTRISHPISTLSHAPHSNTHAASDARTCEFFLHTVVMVFQSDLSQ
jgi:hypothetical protein